VAIALLKVGVMFVVFEGIRPRFPLDIEGWCGGDGGGWTRF
jgi:hypothetical protein